MDEFGVEPDCIICRALVIGYCKGQKADKAESLLFSLTMKHHLHDSESYDALVKIFSERGDLTKSMELQDKLLNLGFAPTSRTCKHVLNGLRVAIEKAKNGGSQGVMAI
ncbi:hypothetical protein Nepgr_026312 [Nepenthes gracilis]|uniref:Pentatricopeptide repeat-containing protein n=1 Tax=Nepenthes gracilis TaxID=150966 RepID=A0AAD3T8U7_NEPGR|nr:hypothetical protein Nepgr_026312 [Nepenthes gracilis]